MINVCEILGTEYPIIQGAMAGVLALSHPVAKALTG